MSSSVVTGSRHRPTYFAWKNLLAWHRKDVCRRWLVFDAFQSDMGLKPKGSCINRRDLFRGYTPSNCYWGCYPGNPNGSAKAALITHNGRTMSVPEWAKIMGVAKSTLYKRLHRHPVATVFANVK